MWGLPFHVVVTVTGALLGLSSLIIGVLALAAYDGDRSKAVGVLFGPRAGADETAAPVPDVGAMIRQVQSRAPEAEFVSAFLEHVGTAGQVVQLGMRTPGGIAFSTTYHFNGDGKSLADPTTTRRGPGHWILGALQPLHFGWFGGLPVKLLYGVLGLTLAIVTHSGVVIWLERRCDKGRPAPAWEKVWAVVGWGQPLAFGTTATLALLFGESLLTATYIATIAVAGALAWLARDGATTARALRYLSAFAMLTAVGTHLHLWWGRITDPMAWYIDLTIALAAMVLALIRVMGATRVRVAAQST